MCNLVHSTVNLRFGIKCLPGISIFEALGKKTGLEINWKN